MLTAVAEWGPESLVAAFIFCMLVGWLNPKRITDKQIKELKEFYEARLEERERHYDAELENLRKGFDSSGQALMQAVHNTQRLIGIVDDYADLTRVATPALVARQDVLEGRHDSE